MKITLEAAAIKDATEDLRGRPMLGFAWLIRGILERGNAGACGVWRGAPFSRRRRRSGSEMLARKSRFLRIMRRTLLLLAEALRLNYIDGPSDAASDAASGGSVAEEVYARTVAKLGREPVEDFRIDFEDGYGNRPDAEEDGHAVAAALEVAKGMAAGSLPPFIGIRVKPLTEELQRRSLRTLDLFLTALREQTGGRLPEHFVVTLPKISVPQQPAALAKVLELFEVASGLPAKTLRFEIMIETTQSIFDREGRLALPLLLEASAGRCVAAHFGTYDYTASCGITAAHQDMMHPACAISRDR